jgi:hypothetical protein
MFPYSHTSIIHQVDIAAASTATAAAATADALTAAGNRTHYFHTGRMAILIHV